MRTEFIRTLMDLAASDERVWLVCGDLGYSVLETYESRFPGRFLNAGVAEQNMTGIAAGLALAGKIPFTYSIANFPVFRCFEQIRNDVCYHRLNVKIVSVGAGFAYGSAGYSHHGLEDIAVMRSLPGITIFSPADPVEAALVTRAALATDGPCYLRLGKAGETVLHRDVPPFAVGRGIWLRRGPAAVLVGTGSVVGVTLAAADHLGTLGLAVSVVSLPTLHPLHPEVVAELAAFPLVVTVEEHRLGGLSGIIAEELAVLDARPRFAAVHVAEPHRVGGTQETLRRRSGVSVEHVVELVRRILGDPA